LVQWSLSPLSWGVYLPGGWIDFVIEKCSVMKNFDG